MDPLVVFEHLAKRSRYVRPRNTDDFQISGFQHGAVVSRGATLVNAARSELETKSLESRGRNP